MSIFTVFTASPVTNAVARACALMRLNAKCPVSKTHRSCIHDAE